MEKASSYIDPSDSGAVAGECVRGVASAGEQAAAAARRRRLRIRGLAVAAGCWSLLAAAALMAPSPRGVGTHKQIGLPPCEFLIRTGWPCPTCGLTTSLSAMAHGELGLAWRAHPFGVALFAFVALLAVAASAEAATARDVIGRLRPGLWWLWAAMIGLPVGWALKVMIGLANGTLPLR